MADLFMAALVGFAAGVAATVWTFRTPLKLGAQAFEDARREKRKQEMVRELGKLTNHGQGVIAGPHRARTEIRE